MVRDEDQEAVGRAISGAAVELALASYPGFHVTAPPGKGEPYGVFEAAYTDAAGVPHVAVLPDGRRVDVGAAPVRGVRASRDLPDVGAAPVCSVRASQHLPDVGSAPQRGVRASQHLSDVGATPQRQHLPDPGGALPAPLPRGPKRRAPLGLVAGARSGDKGGSANVGVWVRTDLAWRWLAHELTVCRFRELLPEVGELAVSRYSLPNLRALNFVVDGLLGEGVAYRARFDPQAKALGEWLRSRHLDIPEVLL